MTEETEPKKITTRIYDRMNSLKVVLAAMVFILPLLGTQLTSFVNWVGIVYNISDNLDNLVAKEEFHKQSKEVLLFIEKTQTDDIRALEWLINNTIENKIMSEDEKEEELKTLRDKYRQHLIAQERIRLRIEELQ